MNDIEDLKISITNKKTHVILELANINTSNFYNCLYAFKKGKLVNLFTNQLFSSSDEIENNYQLAKRFINELETRRILSYKKIKILLLQCGEINILRNHQKNNNKVDFRLNEDDALKNKFNNIIENVDIILNPIHTPMGNQGKMHKRREFLSKNNKYYFSTSNSKENSTNLKLKSIQYAYFNGEEIKPIEIEVFENAIIKTFEI